MTDTDDVKNLEAEIVEEVADDEGELIIEIEGEESSASKEEAELLTELEDDSPVIRKLRNKLKEDSKRAAEAERKLEQIEKDKVQAESNAQLPELGVKPTMESCEYDAEVFEAKLIEWNGKKAAHDTKKAELDAQAAEGRKLFDTKLQTYKEASIKLGVADFKEAEETVLKVLDVNQQGIIVAYAKDPAKLAYVLGKNPAVLAKLAAIQDPIQYAIEVRELENRLKTTRKPSTEPEKKLSGGAKVTGATDAKLDALRKEAEKSGDYTKVSAHKAELRRREAAK